MHTKRAISEQFVSVVFMRRAARLSFYNARPDDEPTELRMNRRIRPRMEALPILAREMLWGGCRRRGDVDDP